MEKVISKCYADSEGGSHLLYTEQNSISYKYVTEMVLSRKLSNIYLCLADPSPVRELKATSQKGSLVQFLSWREPAVPKGPLRVYEVKYGRMKLLRPRLQPEDRDVCVFSKDEPRECCSGRRLIVRLQWSGRHNFYMSLLIKVILENNNDSGPLFT